MEQEDKNFTYWRSLLQEPPQSYQQWFEAEGDFLRSNVPAGAKVLEVGCGDGRSLHYLIDITKRIYGIDYDTEAIAQSREKYRREPNVAILLEDGKDLPFKDDLFDRVLCLTTPANFGHNKPQFYSEMRRVVRPDGQILLSVFNEDPFTFDERMRFYHRINASIVSVNGTTVEFDHPGGVLISEQFSEPQLREIFAENCLAPLEIRKSGIGYFCRVRK